jgi:hypothetical protein
VEEIEPTFANYGDFRDTAGQRSPDTIEDEQGNNEDESVDN